MSRSLRRHLNQLWFSWPILAALLFVLIAVVFVAALPGVLP